eukprot:11052376-Lingulodinium_polyedra.AAC.1
MEGPAECPRRHLVRAGGAHRAPCRGGAGSSCRQQGILAAPWRGRAGRPPARSGSLKAQGDGGTSTSHPRRAIR